MNQIILLFRFLWSPRDAVSEAIDGAGWVAGAILLTIVSVGFSLTVSNRLFSSYEAVAVPSPVIRMPFSQPVRLSLAEEDDDENGIRAQVFRRVPLPGLGDAGWWFISFRPWSFLTLALSLAVLFIPAITFIASFQADSASYSVVLRRDYASLLSCNYFAWAASHLPAVALGGLAAGLGLPSWVYFAIWLGATVYFGFLSVLILGTVTGTGAGLAVGAVVFGGIALRLDSWVLSLATFSPFFTIIWLVPLVLGAVAGMRAAQVQQRSFRRYLEACTLNDHDAEAHVQLGLLYEKRGQREKAHSHYRRALEIDPAEPDANFQLGVVERLSGNFPEAITRFETVVRQDDRFRQSEVWREVGAVYLGAGMPVEARSAIEKYLERRPFDPEGLYYYGEALQKLGESQEAMAAYAKCIEAVNTMPYYRRTQVQRWSKLARARM